MSIGPWLHAARGARELTLPGLQDQAGPMRQRLIAYFSTFEREITEAARPFAFSAKLTNSGLGIEGDVIALQIASRTFDKLCDEHSQITPDRESMRAVIAEVVEHALRFDLSLALNGLPRFLTLKSISQAGFLQMLLCNEGQLFMGLGPTGTGKTHIAIAAGLNQLAEGKVKRVVLTRPHVFEDGEIVTAVSRQEMEADSQSDYFDDILFDILGQDRTRELKRELQLEVMPFGRLRSRTFNDSFVLIDEAQNTTIAKMRMAVNRIGSRTRMVLTGDPTHCEVLGDEPSGLIDLIDLIEGTELAQIHDFDNHAIIRNDVVSRIDRLYAERQALSRASMAAA